MASKKTIQQYWTENVPGLDLSSKKFSPEAKEFYLDADRTRFKYEPYVTPLLDSFAVSGSRILEIGCGLGSDSRYMLKRGAKVISLDLSWRNVYFSLKGIRLFNLDGQGVCADAENLPFCDNSFDVVYSFGVLHHTPGTARAIEEIRRVLRPGGLAAIMLYHKGYAYYLLLLCYGWKNWDQERLMSKYDHTPLSKLYSKKEIRGLFAGFKEVRVGMDTYGGIQVHPVLKYVHMVLGRNRFLMRRFGSFAIIKAKK